MAEWEDVITDPAERQVFDALASKEWDYRTVPGLAKDSGLPEDRVRDILERRKDLVRRPPITGPNGEELFTLNGPSLREVLSIARAAATKSSS